MSDLVGNPEDRFSRNEAQLMPLKDADGMVNSVDLQIRLLGVMAGKLQIVFFQPSLIFQKRFPAALSSYKW